MVGKDVCLTDVSPDIFYSGQLAESSWLSWLENRGILEASATNPKVRLGFVGHPLSGHDRFAGCLAIPYYDGRLRFRGLRFRYSDDDAEQRGQKYDQPKAQKVGLYGAHLIQKPEVYLTEGELDAIVLRQMGKHAIGVPGATSFKEEWGYLFRDCDVVNIIYDADDAGQKGAYKLARFIQRCGPMVNHIKLPQGRDVNDLYLEDRAELERLLA